MQDKEIIKTSVYLHRKLHEEAKMMAILTRSNLSTLIRVALREKIERLKER